MMVSKSILNLPDAAAAASTAVLLLLLIIVDNLSVDYFQPRMELKINSNRMEHKLNLIYLSNM